MSFDMANHLIEIIELCPILIPKSPRGKRVESAAILGENKSNHPTTTINSLKHRWQAKTDRSSGCYTPRQGASYPDT
jgi:hypothetical protein